MALDQLVQQGLLGLVPDMRGTGPGPLGGK